MGGIMLDSTNPAAIMDAIKARRTWRNMAIVAGAGYIDGAASAWPPGAFTQLRALGVVAVEITVTGIPGADVAVADVEKGDLTPEQGAAWAVAEAKAGRFPVVYVDRSNKPAVFKELASADLTPGKEYGLWVATLDGTFTDTGGGDLRSELGVMAVQFAPAARLGIDADASVITPQGNGWLHIDPTWEEHALDLSQELFRVLRDNQ